jgi:hypothetical protein
MVAKRKKTVISSSASANHVLISDGSTVATEFFDMSQTEGTWEKTLQKWDIPVPPKYEPAELTLLSRLVWVRYRQLYWWPAILYQNYKEVSQTQGLWDQLDVWRQMKIGTSTVLFPSHPRNCMRIGRLLGRPTLELLELKKDVDHCEFYWQLPNILPHTCNSEFFTKDPDLYYDWHRALDQVEGILRDFLGKRFALTAATDDSKTWLKKAKEAELAKWAEEHPYLALCCNCGLVDTR